MSPLRRASLWLPVLAYGALLFFLSGQSRLPEIAEAVSDKVEHAGAYALLAALVLRATHGGLRPLRLGPTLIGLAATVAYGASDEIHQAFVPGRDPDVLDFAADAAGACLAAVGLALVLRLGGRRRG